MQVGLSQTISTPSKVLRECDVANVKWSVGLGGQESELVGSLHTSTKASAVPEVTTGGAAAGGGIVGKKPPPVLEWNPLVHTEWQLGVSLIYCYSRSETVFSSRVYYIHISLMNFL